MAGNANFCTLNPLTQVNSGTFSEGNLFFTHTANAWRTTAGTMGMKTGKWYWEAYQHNDVSGNGFPQGIYDMDSGKFVSNQCSDYPGQSNSSFGTAYASYTNTGTYAKWYHNGSNGDLSSLSAGSSGDKWQMAFDADNGKLYIGKNGSWDNSGNPASGTNPKWTSIPSSTWVPITCSWNTGNSEDYPQNFGQDSTFAGRISAGGNADGNGYGDFQYAPPTGFLALCSANLPISDDIDPAQTNDDYVGGKHFNAATWTGNGTNDTAISLDMAPDLVVIKETGASNNWYWIDSTRGVTKTLQTNGSAVTHTEAGVLNAFTSTGFTVGTSGGSNNTSDTYVGYGWRANGGTTSSNSEGDITSTVQANQDAGFSIVTYTGDLTSSGNRTVGHGLSQAPDFIIRKGLNVAERWAVSHVGCTSFNYMMEMNSTAAQTDKSGNGSMSAPTTTVFSNNYTDGYAVNGTNYVAYCWHSVAGFSKFGKYHGSSTASGSFINTGFRPKFLFVKKIDEASTTYGWAHWTTASQNYNATTMNGGWFDTAAAYGNNYYIDIYSNGFKFWDNNTNLEETGHTYIYGAWGDTPGKYSNAR